MPREPIVMFELGPAFETKPDFHGTILASYAKERSPLQSGYLLHPERLQGKAAALEVFYGDGRIRWPHKERVPELQDASIGMDDALRRKAADYLRGLRRLTADLRKKEFEQQFDVDGLLDRYKLTDLDDAKGQQPLIIETYASCLFNPDSVDFWLGRLWRECRG